MCVFGGYVQQWLYPVHRIGIGEKRKVGVAEVTQLHQREALEEIAKVAPKYSFKSCELTVNRW